METKKSCTESDLGRASYNDGITHYLCCTNCGLDFTTQLDFLLHIINQKNEN